MLNTNYNGEYPLCLDACTLDDKKEMLLLKKVFDNNIVIIRRLQIKDQLSAKMPNEENGQGIMVLNLSQDTEHMSLSDIKIETQYKR